MPLEKEQYLKALKLDGKVYESEEEFVADFEKAYKPVGHEVDETTKDRIVGGVLGPAEVILKRELKEAGIEFQLDKNKKFTDNLADALKTINSVRVKEVEEWKVKSGSGNDDVIKTLSADIDKYKNKYNEEKQARELALTDFQSKITEYEGKIKNVRRDYKLADVYGNSIKWKTGASEIEKKGFHTHINEKYSADLDDSENLIVTDKQGKQIPNPKVVGQFLSLPEVLEMEGVALKVWEVNPHASKNTPFQTKTFAASPAPVQNNGQRLAVKSVI